MNRRSFECDIGFADAQYRYFQITENDNLTIFLTSWDEREIKMEFYNVLSFYYTMGDIISEFYEISESSFLNESIDRYYVKRPVNPPFKHYQIEDVGGFPFIEVVSESVQVVKTDKIVRFTNLSD